MKKENTKRVIAGAAAVILILIAVTVRMMIIPHSTGENISAVTEDVSQGLEKIKASASQEAAAAEEALRAYRQEQMAAYYESGNYRELYKNAMLMGDSHAEGFVSFGILPSNMVAATIGKSFYNCDADRKKAVAAKPDVLFVNYGQNSISWHDGNTTDMAEAYRLFLRDLQAELPDTRIVVVSVLESQPEAVESEPYSPLIPELNTKIAAMCSEEGWQFIDINPLLADEYYEPDHIHADARFHKIWLGYMASEAGLMDAGV